MFEEPDWPGADSLSSLNASAISVEKNDDSSSKKAKKVKNKTNRTPIVIPEEPGNEETMKNSTRKKKKVQNLKKEFVVNENKNEQNECLDHHQGKSNKDLKINKNRYHKNFETKLFDSSVSEFSGSNNKEIVPVEEKNYKADNLTDNSKSSLFQNPNNKGKKRKMKKIENISDKIAMNKGIQDYSVVENDAAYSENKSLEPDSLDGNSSASIQNVIEESKRNKRKKRNRKNGDKVVADKGVEENSASFEGVEPELMSPESKRAKNFGSSYGDTLRGKLVSSRFRYLNEYLYTSTSEDALNKFRQDPESFDVYHKGFQLQVAKWPTNPMNIIMKYIQKLPKGDIADFGCGDAQIAKSLPDRKVYSFDLVAHNDLVTACDMAHVPLKNATVDLAIFCLSLMGTNLSDFIMEAIRVLKVGGFLLLAEVTSRCNDIDGFLRALEKFGFKLLKKNVENTHFFFAAFKKVSSTGNKAKLPKIYLKPCFYKKR